MVSISPCPEGVPVSKIVHDKADIFPYPLTPVERRFLKMAFRKVKRPDIKLQPLPGSLGHLL